MAAVEPEDKAPDESALALDGGYRAVLRERGGQLAITAPDGRVCLDIQVTPQGLKVSLDSASLAVKTSGEVSLACGELAVSAERDIRLSAGGSIISEAQEQHMSASLGDVSIEANDDVVIDGERVRLNSPEPARLGPDALGGDG